MKLLLLFAVVMLSLSAGEEAKVVEKAPKIVATVNGVPILEEDLNKQVNILIPSSYYHANVGEEKLKELKSDCLEKLINSELMYQDAKKKGIVVSKKELSKLEDKVRKAFISEEYFKKAVAGKYKNYRVFQEELIKYEMIKKYFDANIKKEFTDKALRDYYDKNKFKFKEPEKLKISLIQVQIDPGAKDGKDVASKKIHEAYQKLQDGAFFADIAAEYSDAMSRVKGGDMGYIHKGRLDPEIEELAFSLKTGELSKVMEATTAFYIIKVEEKKTPHLMPFESVKSKLKKELETKEEEEKTKALLEKLKKDAAIEIL